MKKLLIATSTVVLCFLICNPFASACRIDISVSGILTDSGADGLLDFPDSQFSFEMQFNSSSPGSMVDYPGYASSYEWTPPPADFFVEGVSVGKARQFELLRLNERLPPDYQPSPGADQFNIIGWSEIYDDSFVITAILSLYTLGPAGADLSLSQIDPDDITNFWVTLGDRRDPIAHASRYNQTASISVGIVPEPATMLLLASGFIVLAGIKQKRLKP